MNRQDRTQKVILHTVGVTLLVWCLLAFAIGIIFPQVHDPEPEDAWKINVLMAGAIIIASLAFGIRAGILAWKRTEDPSDRRD